MLEFQTVIANDLRSAAKLVSASRLSWGRPSFTSTVKEYLKKCRTPTVPDPFSEEKDGSFFRNFMIRIMKFSKNIS